MLRMLDLLGRLTIKPFSSVTYRLVLLGCVISPAFGDEALDGGERVANRPEAVAPYGEMLKAVRDAETLQYTARLTRTSAHHGQTSCSYRVWLKKPNFFRVEAFTTSGEPTGVLIGDGETLWIHWPNGRPSWPLVKETAANQLTRSTSYMKKDARPGKHSILHEIVFLGAEMRFPVLDASTFYGHVDSLQQYLDSVNTVASATIAGEPCDGFEVNFMNGQRRWHVWLSQRDHLPRRLRETVKVNSVNTAEEQWSDVRLNDKIAQSMFQWSPPADWQQWQLPSERDAFPKPGSAAPLFDLASATGGRIRLIDYKGSVVLLNFWRLGCPPCRVETAYLQELHTKHESQGLVVLRVNVSDDRRVLVDYLKREGVTFPNIHDVSKIGEKTHSEHYGVGAIPMSCVIDRGGLVIDAWSGHSEERLVDALSKAGVALRSSNSQRD